MTTTMMRMRDVVELVQEKHCGSKVIIGGAVTTQSFADEVGADGYFMKGTYQATELNPDGTNLFLGDNNTFFRPSENDHRMKGTRVYFIIPRKAVDQVLSYDTETIVDGIVDVEVNSQSNSQKVYNINGVYVGDNLRNLTPGVYIVDGKKVVVTNR